MRSMVEGRVPQAHTVLASPLTASPLHHLSDGPPPQIGEEL